MHRMLVLCLAGLLGFTFMRGVDHLREPGPYSYTAPNREFTLELPAKPDRPPQAVDNPDFPDGLTANMVLVGDEHGGIGVLQCIVDPSLRFDAGAAMRGSVLSSAASSQGRVTKYVSKPFAGYRGAEAVITTPQGHLYERVVYTGPNLMGVISPSLDDYKRALSTLTFASDLGSAGSLS